MRLRNRINERKVNLDRNPGDVGVLMGAVAVSSCILLLRSHLATVPKKMELRVVSFPISPISTTSTRVLRKNARALNSARFVLFVGCSSELQFLIGVKVENGHLAIVGVWKFLSIEKIVVVIGCILF